MQNNVFFPVERQREMQGSSHYGFAAASAVTVNNIVYRFTPSFLPRSLEDILHTIGAPLAYQNIPQAVLHYFSDLTSWSTLTHQLAFYGCALYFARWPDTLELRRDPETGKQVRRDHRGCTHSCFFVFFLIFIALFVATVGIPYLVSQHIVLPSFLLQEALAAFLGIVVGVLSHIVADSLTTQKVKVLWPDEESYGLGLFSNERPGEYIVLWGFIFLVGVFVGLGWFGI